MSNLFPSDSSSNGGDAYMSSNSNIRNNHNVRYGNSLVTDSNGGLVDFSGKRGKIIEEYPKKIVELEQISSDSKDRR